jgi:hypothetical protein
VDEACPGVVVRARCGTRMRTRGVGWVEPRRQPLRRVAGRRSGGAWQSLRKRMGLVRPCSLSWSGRPNSLSAHVRCVSRARAPHVGDDPGRWA